MSKEPVEYLKHIRDESLYILSITSKGISKEEFLNDETLKRAVVRSGYKTRQEVISDLFLFYRTSQNLTGIYDELCGIGESTGCNFPFDPANLVQALIKIVKQKEPPCRFACARFDCYSFLSVSAGFRLAALIV